MSAAPSAPPREAGDYTAWQTEMERSLKRLRNLSDLVADPRDPAVGQSPRQEVYRKHKARLYWYEGTRQHETPILFVPNLGISRPYIFDLMPKASFIEHMVEQGFSFYLLDWGVFGPEDDHLTFTDCARARCPGWPRSSWSTRTRRRARSSATAWARRWP